jgi:hypothetical protein
VSYPKDKSLKGEGKAWGQACEQGSAMAAVVVVTVSVAVAAQKQRVERHVVYKGRSDAA